MRKQNKVSFSLTFKKIKNWTNLPVIVKGIQDPVDAMEAIAAGADGIWVSNHGGRQLEW